MNIHNEFRNIFTAIGCFRGTFSLNVQDNTKPYQMLSTRTTDTGPNRGS